MVAQSHLFCGEPQPRLQNLLRSDPQGGVAALFEGRDVHWTHAARVAIRAACDVLNIGKNDHVLSPAYNCGSEIDPLIDAGAAVSLYPCGPDLAVTPDDLAPLLRPETKAIYLTHYFGILQPHRHEIRRLCDDHGLRLIEDCALSLLSGASPADGRTGDVSIFCLHKFPPIIGGGALVLNDPDLSADGLFPHPAPAKTVAKSAIRAGLANILGPARSRRLMARIKGAPATPAQASGTDEDIPSSYYFDTNLRGRRISGFAARTLRSIPVADTIARRRANWQTYHDLLSDLPGVSLVTPTLADDTCPLNMPVRLADRDRIAPMLQARGIGVTRWWAGYNRNVDWSGQDDAIALKETVLSLPLHQNLGPDHIRYIVQELRAALAAT